MPCGPSPPELIDEAYGNTARFLADGASAGIPHEPRTRVDKVPELAVEVQVQEQSILETRSADEDR